MRALRTARRLIRCLFVTSRRGRPHRSYRPVATWHVHTSADNARVLRQRFRSLVERHWGPGEATDDAELVFAELTSNAVRHTCRDMIVTVLLSTACVRAEIRDSVRRGAIRPPRRASMTAENGRGLLLVHELSHRWGVRRHLRGKTIWFEVPAPPAETPQVPARAGR